MASPGFAWPIWFDECWHDLSRVVTCPSESPLGDDLDYLSRGRRRHR